MNGMTQSLNEDLDGDSHTSVGGRVGRQTRAYRCGCGASLFFANTQCLACGSALGYLPDQVALATLDPATEPDAWRARGRPELLRFCANRQAAAACNWMVLASGAETHCLACRLNRTIPD